MNTHNLLKLRKSMTQAARSTAPVDTGNLKYNGIYSLKTSKGFKIVWDSYFAHYIEIQDKYYHKHFVNYGIARALSLLDEEKLKSKMQSKKEVKNPEKYLRSSLQYALQKSIKCKKHFNFYKGEAKMKARFEESIAFSKKYNPNETRDNYLYMYNSDKRIQDVYEYKDY